MRTLRASLAALLLPAALAAQGVPPADSTPTPAVPPPVPGTGLTIGVTGFTGGLWQPSGFEIGLVRGLGGGPARSVYAVVRLGSFSQDQAVMFSNTTGFFSALLVGVRVPLATLAAVGAEGEPSQYVRFVGVLEAGGEANARSPLPQGSFMGVVAPLVGLSFGGGEGSVDQNFALLVGPSWWIGSATDAHFQLSLRYQIPLGGGTRRRGR
jgi:hypothetical protein